MSRSLVICAAVGLLLVPVHATARTKQNRKGALTRVKAEKPASMRKSPTGKDRAKAKPARPARLSADDVLGIQRTVAPIRDRQIALLDQLIEDTPNSRAMEKADLLFRKAELQAQKSRFLRFQAMELHSRIGRTKAAKKKRALTAEQRELLVGSKNALVAAVRTYARIFNDDVFINYPRRDQVLYYCAHSLDELDRNDEARKIYHRLIKDHPGSPLVAGAYLAFADYYFENNALQNAEGFYDRVIALKTPNTYDYAIYKRGWSTTTSAASKTRSKPSTTWPSARPRTPNSAL